MLATVRLNRKRWSSIWMTDGSSVSDMIGSVPLFSGLDSKDRKAFAQSGKERSYKEGEVVVSQGATGVGFFLVLEGVVEVRKGVKVLATLSRGDFFGEMSLLDNQPRTADVVAVKATRCFVLSAWSFSALIKTNPRMAMGMLKELVKRLRAAQSTPAE